MLRLRCCRSVSATMVVMSAVGGRTRRMGAMAAMLVGLRDDPGLDGAGGEVEQLVDGALGGVRLDVAVVGLDGSTLEGEGEAESVGVH